MCHSVPACPMSMVSLLLLKGGGAVSSLNASLPSSQQYLIAWGSKSLQFCATEAKSEVQCICAAGAGPALPIAFYFVAGSATNGTASTANCPNGTIVLSCSCKCAVTTISCVPQTTGNAACTGADCANCAVTCGTGEVASVQGVCA